MWPINRRQFFLSPCSLTFSSLRFMLLYNWIAKHPARTIRWKFIAISLNALPAELEFWRVLFNSSKWFHSISKEKTEENLNHEAQPQNQHGWRTGLRLKLIGAGRAIERWSREEEKAQKIPSMAALPGVFDGAHRRKVKQAGRKNIEYYKRNALKKPREKTPELAIKRDFFLLS